MTPAQHPRWVLVALAGVPTEDGRRIDEFRLNATTHPLYHIDPESPPGLDHSMVGSVELSLTPAGHVMALLAPGLHVGIELANREDYMEHEGFTIYSVGEVLGAFLRPKSESSWEPLR